MKKSNIKAVHDDDILSLLQSLGVKEEFERGETVCAICGEKVTMNNFQAIFPLNGKVAFCCSNPKCYMTVIQKER